MTDYYVYSGAAGAGTGADWANAYTSLSAAASGKTASDRLLVAHDHDANYGTDTTIAFPTTPGLQVLCVNRLGSVPPVAADLQVRAGRERTSGSFGITLTGFAYIEGMIFEPAAGVGGGFAAVLNLGATNGATATGLVLKGCAMFLSQTASASARINLSGGGASSRDVYLEWIDTQVKFGNASTFITGGGRLLWRDTASAIQGTPPTTLLVPLTGCAPDWEVRGVDLSAAGVGCNLVDGSATINARVGLIDCKLNASVTIASGTNAGPGGVHTDVIDCDSGDPSTVIRKEYHRFAGNIVQSTSITKDSGASDVAAYSMKMTANASASRAFPLELPLEVWNDTVGSAVTVSVDVLADDGAALTDADVWLDVEYLGTAGSTKASFANDGAATILTSGSARTGTANPANWNGITVGAKEYTLSVSVTPQEKGIIRATINLAKASQVLYADPVA